VKERKPRGGGAQDASITSPRTSRELAGEDVGLSHHSGPRIAGRVSEAGKGEITKAEEGEWKAKSYAGGGE